MFLQSQLAGRDPMSRSSQAFTAAFGISYSALLFALLHPLKSFPKKVSDGVAVVMLFLGSFFSSSVVI